MECKITLAYHLH